MKDPRFRISINKITYDDGDFYQAIVEDTKTGMPYAVVNQNSITGYFSSKKDLDTALKELMNRIQSQDK
jgi:hypothetical protein